MGLKSSPSRRGARVGAPSRDCRFEAEFTCNSVRNAVEGNKGSQGGWSGRRRRRLVWSGSGVPWQGRSVVACLLAWRLARPSPAIAIEGPGGARLISLEIWGECRLSHKPAAATARFGARCGARRGGSGSAGSVGSWCCAVICREAGSDGGGGGGGSGGGVGARGV